MLMPLLRSAPKHFAAGVLIVVAGASGACALVTWYVRCSSVFGHGADDAANATTAIVATVGVIAGFVALILAGFGVALVVLHRGVTRARRSRPRVRTPRERASFADVDS